jgi:hypothetical protein
MDTSDGVQNHGVQAVHFPVCSYRPLLDPLWQVAVPFLYCLSQHADSHIQEGHQSKSITQLHHGEWEGIAAEGARILRCLGQYDTSRIVPLITQHTGLTSAYKRVFLSIALECASLVQPEYKALLLEGVGNVPPQAALLPAPHLAGTANRGQVNTAEAVTLFGVGNGIDEDDRMQL